jgi:spore germination cell wall hydrolase CwlJ-like protein
MNLGAYKGRVHKPSKVGPRAGGFLLSFLALLLSPFPAQAEDQKNCLAEAVYFEARSEPFIGQIAVAGVVLERVQRPEYPNNVCDVVHQGHYVGGMPIRNRCAFSYWCYHASYVKPNWSDDMTFMARIGPHLFYGD